MTAKDLPRYSDFILPIAKAVGALGGPLARRACHRRLIAFHRAVADGGVGMTTVAYCCVAPEGASAPGQMVMSPAALPGLRRLTDSMHEAGAAVSAQLDHAGMVAKRNSPGSHRSPRAGASTRCP